VTWTLADYVDRGVKHATSNPVGFAFVSVLFALFAGYDWRELRGTSPLGFAHLHVYLELLLSAICGYFLTRTIRQLREGSVTAD
jgi:hypothetical protein